MVQLNPPSAGEIAAAVNGFNFGRNTRNLPFAISVAVRGANFFLIYQRSCFIIHLFPKASDVRIYCLNYVVGNGTI
ncbi:MAG: hypothetical protein GX051_07700 [Clostridiales bacterium]|nr:hypothetical protein [Clostridiales bacterium]